MHKIHLQRLAERDIKNSWFYSFKNWGETQADHYLDELEVGIKSMAKNPDIGINCDYIREGYRQYHVNRHIIFYRNTTKIIHIIRVLHDSMDFKRRI